MTVDGQYWQWTIKAGEYLDDFTLGTGTLFKAIALNNGKLAHNGLEAGGILVYGNEKDENITIGYLGIIKFTAGEEIGPGDLLTVGPNGYMRVATPDEWVVGRCLDMGVAKGGVGTGAFNFVSPHRMH